MSGRWEPRIFISLFGLKLLVGWLLPEATSFVMAKTQPIFGLLPGIGFFLTMALAGIGFFRYLASLADRIPDSRFAARSRRMAIGWGGFVLLNAVYSWGVLAIRDATETLTPIPPRLLSTIVTLLVFACPVMILLVCRLLIHHRRAMKRAAAHHVSYGAVFGDVPTDKAIATSGNIDIPADSSGTEPTRAGAFQTPARQSVEQITTSDRQRESPDATTDERGTNK